MDSSSRHTLAVVLLALTILGLLSAMPWSSLTGGRMSDFSLISDLVGTTSGEPAIPALVNESLEAELAEIPADTVAAAVEVNVEDTVVAAPVALAEAPMENGHVQVEAYGGAMFPRFRQALAQASSRTVRIAVLGDSFIEADIMTQDLRRLLQERYGGAGVGYMAMHSDFPGFRQSIRQSDRGWNQIDVRNMRRSDSLRTINNEYAVTQAGTVTYTGTDFDAGTQAWSRSRFVFLAKDSAVVKMTTDAGEQVFDAEPSGMLQCVEVYGNTRSLEIECNGEVGALGAYLDGDAGRAGDCMSGRGHAGLPLRFLNPDMCGQLRNSIDYDLIILEYGTNAMTAGQTNYESYAMAFRRAINKIQSLYPNADIMLLGVGDRGRKQGTAIVSMEECTGMTNAQRAAASETGIHFFDVRAAQGGSGAAAEWRRRGLMNADYIHINHEGGAVLADEIAEALFNATK